LILRPLERGADPEDPGVGGFLASIAIAIPGYHVASVTPFESKCPAQPAIQALIVDDEHLARERTQSLLKTEADFRIVGECSGGRESSIA
jgi:hypothetical protein